MLTAGDRADLPLELSDEPIVGWRTWFVLPHELLLRPIYMRGLAWKPRQTLEAVCPENLHAVPMAHGLIIVNSGMLARAENEAQLAGVLAHEVAHITHRHQIREHRHLQNRRTAANVAAFLGTLALAAAAVDQSIEGNYATTQALAQAAPPLLTLGLNLTYSAMVTGYSRDMEREADEQAVKAMAAAGYPLGAATTRPRPTLTTARRAPDMRASSRRRDPWSAPWVIAGSGVCSWPIVSTSGPTARRRRPSRSTSS